MTMRLAWPLIALLCVAVACKKSPAVQEPEIHPIYGEVIAEFRGELTEDDLRREEDDSPVDHHDIDLVEGQNVFVRMEALTSFTTYLLIAPPDREGGFINNNCMPGELAASCYRFTAAQTGSYRLMANSDSETDFGEYVLWVFSETDEEAAERMQEHRRAFALDTERRKQERRDVLEEKLGDLIRAVSEHKKKKAAQDVPEAAPNEVPVEEQDAATP